MRAILVLAALVSATACGDDDAHTAPHDAGVDASPDAACFTNPHTHLEIINACTTAQKIYKDSHPPLLGADGSLPPLPL